MLLKTNEGGNLIDESPHDQQKCCSFLNSFEKSKDFNLNIAPLEVSHLLKEKIEICKESPEIIDKIKFSIKLKINNREIYTLNLRTCEEIESNISLFCILHGFDQQIKRKLIESIKKREEQNKGNFNKTEKIYLTLDSLEKEFS